jgi:uncharacterized membrane protein
MCYNIYLIAYCNLGLFLLSIFHSHVMGDKMHSLTHVRFKAGLAREIFGLQQWQNSLTHTSP